MMTGMTFSDLTKMVHCFDPEQRISWQLDAARNEMERVIARRAERED